MTPLLFTADNPHSSVRANGKRGWFYPTRNASIRAIVLHTAETDPSPASAENVGRWQRDAAPVPSSYHVLVDSDSTVRALPDGATAFHCVGFNSPSLGLSFATRAAWWGRFPAWDRAALAHGAAQVASWCRRYDIPPVLLTREQALAGRSGIVTHAVMDPRRRSDPGDLFPMQDLMWRVRAGLWPAAVEFEEDVMASLEDVRKVVRDELLGGTRERLNEAVRLGQVAAAGAVAAIRAEVGLPPEPESDLEHVKRIREGVVLGDGSPYDLVEVRRRLESKASG